MGGDHGPDVVVPGADLALLRYPDIRFHLFGDEARIKPLLEQYPKVAGACELFHTDMAVAMDEKPSQAVRRSRRESSMWLTVDAVRQKTADCAVSGGNTGALMAMAHLNLRNLSGVARPAIAAIWPTMRGESIVLDVGATIGGETGQLVEFAVMGEAMAKALFGLERPSVGLLNIGVEEIKGLEPVREAHQILKQQSHLQMDYHGFVEGDDIGKGTVDVVVTEGFAGNIALKTAEGTAVQIASYLRAAMGRTWLSRLGYLLAAGAFRALREKMDPRRANGGVFLGLNGVVIKSHGGTDSEGFASAIGLGYEMVRNGLLAKIGSDIDQYHSERGDHPAPEAKSGTS
jgi:glycerol-3-phosphate acyltransferase PlsX